MHSNDEELRRAIEAVYQRIISRTQSRGASITGCHGLMSVSGDRFYQIISHNPLVVVVFTSPLCPACEAYKPIVEWVAEALEGVACFLVVDVYRDEELAIRYGVEMTPTTIVFANGEPIVGAMGILDPETLLDMISEAASKLEEGKAKTILERIKNAKNSLALRGYM